MILARPFKWDFFSYAQWGCIFLKNQSPTDDFRTSRDLIIATPAGERLDNTSNGVDDGIGPALAWVRTRPLARSPILQCRQNLRKCYPTRMLQFDFARP